MPRNKPILLILYEAACGRHEIVCLKPGMAAHAEFAEVVDAEFDLVRFAPETVTDEPFAIACDFHTGGERAEALLLTRVRGTWLDTADRQHGPRC